MCWLRASSIWPCASVTDWSVVAARSVHRRRGLERTVAQLRATARVEERTQLRNRQAFTEDLTLELRRCERSGRPASLVVVAVQPARYDQDPASEFADAIRGAVRSVDVAYRIGESELALILPDTRARGALVAAKRISERLAARQDLAASIAIGVAELGPGLDHHQVFRNAYCALLAAGR